MTIHFINPIGRGLAKKMPGRIGVRTRQKELVHDKDKCSAVGAEPLVFALRLAV